jgi:hypothetical protein
MLAVLIAMLLSTVAASIGLAVSSVFTLRRWSRVSRLNGPQEGPPAETAAKEA